MTFRVRDIDAARRFSAAVLRPLGYTLSFDQVFASHAVIGFGDQSAGQGRIDTWFVSGPSAHGGPPTTTGCHLCWAAPSREAVDAFHAAALAEGARDNSPPGLRPHYHPHDYGAFAIDGEGNNIEAACHRPE